jgi:hypothetical protein
MQIAYLTTDEVNEHLATEMAARCGATLNPLSPVDVPAKRQYDAVLCDWDFLPRRQRQRMLRQLIRKECGYFVAVHSYNLNAQQARALRRRGVKVYRRLQPSIFARLTPSLNRSCAYTLLRRHQRQEPERHAAHSGRRALAWCGL